MKCVDVEHSADQPLTTFAQHVDENVFAAELVSPTVSVVKVASLCTETEQLLNRVGC